MHRKVKSESTLFYHVNPAVEFMALNARLVKAFARTGIKLRPRLATETELAFALGGVTLSVSLSQTPLDIRAFENVNRPKAPTTTEKTARIRLFRHCAAVVINVSGPLAQAKLETQLAICFIATQQMQELAAPNLIHWSKSNVLYTSEEFRSASGAHDPAPAQARPAPQNRQCFSRAADAGDPALWHLWRCHHPDRGRRRRRPVCAASGGPFLPGAVAEGTVFDFRRKCAILGG